MVKHNLKKGSGACCPTLPHFLVSSTKRFERAGVELCIYQSTGRSSGLPPLPWQAEPRDPSPFTTSQTVNLSLSLFPYMPFPSMYFTPFTFHLPFQKSVFHNAAGRPRPEGQLQAPRGRRVFGHICQIAAYWLKLSAVPEFLPQPGCE